MRFDVKRAGKECVIVSCDHPAFPPKFFKVKSEDFWEKSKEEQRESAIEYYVQGFYAGGTPLHLVAEIDPSGKL